jgi:hypothetical protein
MPSDEDRRQAATRIVMSDGNGGRWVGYSFTIKRAHTWLGVIASVLGIAATVYGSVQLSVTNVVRHEIERQIADERSPFNRQLQSEFEHGCVLGQSDVRQRMREVERELAVLREQNAHTNQELSELRSDVREILKLVR